MPEPQIPVTQKDVAHALNLAQSTVSRALSNSSKIPAPLRKHIQMLAEQMGYRPNAMASSLVHLKQASKTAPVQAALAWLNGWPDSKQLRRYREFDYYWRGAQKTAEKLGFRLEEFIISKDMPLSRIEKILLTRNICGVLIPPHRFSIPWEDLIWKHFSVVRFGRTVEIPFHTVLADMVGNAMLAFEKIRGKGYQRIGFIGDTRHKAWIAGAGALWAQQYVPARNRVPPLLISGKDLLEDQRNDSQRPLPASFVWYRSPEEYQKIVVAWLKKYEPDAIYTDQAQLPETLKKAGYRMPEDVALAATTVLDCPIDAGIYSHPEEIGRAAMLLLISLIHDNDCGVPSLFRQIAIPGRWVDGTALPEKEPQGGKSSLRIIR